MNEIVKYLKKSAEIIGSEINPDFKEKYAKVVDFETHAKAVMKKERIGRAINPIAFQLGYEAGFQTALMYVMKVGISKKK